MANYLRQLSNPQNLLRAWNKLSKKKHSRGFDEQTIEKFKRDLEQNIRELSGELRAGSFEFTPLLGCLHEKGGGGKRPIKIPAVRDRVVLKAIQLLISHRFDKYNLPCSYGYITGVSTIRAIERVRQLAESGKVWVLEADMSKFFDTVNQTMLMERFVRQIRVKSLEDIVGRALRVEVGNLDSFRPEDKDLFPTAESGIPQGGVLSPMLANFYLYPFDKAMLDAGYNLVRYADDFVVMCESPSEAQDAYQLSKQILEDKLRLILHELGGQESKTKITLYSKGFTFLGFHFQGGLITPASKSVKKFKERISAITDPRQGQTLLKTLTALKNTIDGWAHAYSFYDALATFHELDSHVREQVSVYLRFHRLLPGAHVINTGQRNLLGIPSLAGIREASVRGLSRGGAPAVPVAAPPSVDAFLKFGSAQAKTVS